MGRKKNVLNEIRIRRNIQVEFWKTYKDLFIEYESIHTNFTSSSPIVKKIAGLAREEIGYSSKTNDVDIVNSINRIGKKAR